MEKELRAVKETLADVEKVKDMANKATILQQYLSARTEHFSENQNSGGYTASQSAPITRTLNEGGSNALNDEEIQPYPESEIMANQDVGDTNAGTLSSRFANSVLAKGGHLHVPTQRFSTDSGPEHSNNSNSQSLQEPSLGPVPAQLERLDKSLSSEAHDYNADQLPCFPDSRVHSGDRPSPSKPTITRANTSPRIAFTANNKYGDVTTPTSNQESFAQTSERRWIPIFIQRLIKAINDPRNEGMIRWSEDGNTVLIVDEQELITKLLPTFNTTTYASFTQQLNTHGFRRVEQGYENPLFKRDRPDAICLIRRKDSKSQPPSYFNSGTLSPSDVANPQSQSSPIVPERLGIHGGGWSTPSNTQTSSVQNDASSGRVSRGVNYKVIRKRRRQT
ncbi:heat shock factor family protein [Aspergillus tanneri]|uniref:HSF-type DNA-binding domain-containing protein n=1 Tax=Aspergillus tanneri TaxID=1220188 RepID=A0A5M9MUS9_9EURO|nr:uncharacterized protein ATNIH1004_004274 [Aspergillus tanneri]KAA8648389.1 hypothetical protein ATNIH1004_004274 [Aspergillus tanneri]